MMRVIRYFILIGVLMIGGAVGYLALFPPSVVLPVDTVEPVVETAFEELVFPRVEAESGYRIYWEGPDPVEAEEGSFDGQDAIVVDLDLKAKVHYWPDPNLDVDLIIVPACRDGDVFISLVDYDADVGTDLSGLMQTFGFALLTDFEANRQLNRALTDEFRQSLDTALPCENVIIDDERVVIDLRGLLR